MPAKPTTRVDWAAAPMVFIVLPSCLACGSGRYQTIRSEANGDGTTTRKAKCLDCAAPFKIVVELPNFGNDDGADE